MLRPTILAVLVACGHSSDPPSTKPPPTIPGVELAELAYGGREIPAEAPIVVVSPTAISVEGQAVVRVQPNGTVDPAEKEGGAFGLKMPRLSLALGRLPGGGHNQPLEVAIDRRLTYRLMIEVLYSAKQKEAGWKEFALLARAHTGGAIVAIPLTLPSREPPSQANLGGAIANARTGEARIVVHENHESGPHPSFRVEPMPDGGDTTLTPSAVLAKIQSAYLGGGMRRCYKDALAISPTLTGKLQLAFTVAETGRTLQSKATGLTPELDRCVETLMGSWRFPIPKDKAGNPTTASFALSMRLTAEGGGSAEPRKPAPEVAAPVPTPEPETDVKPVVTVTKTEILVWSISQLEGSLMKPLLRVASSDATAAAQVTRTLADIIKRRWSGKPRPETSRSIIFMADGDVAMPVVIEMIGAIRATPDGGVLFPDVLLSSGFE